MGLSYSYNRLIFFSVQGFVKQYPRRKLRKKEKSGKTNNVLLVLCLCSIAHLNECHDTGNRLSTRIIERKERRKEITYQSSIKLKLKKPYNCMN